MVDDFPKRSSTAERSARYRARKRAQKAAANPILGRDEASSSAAVHQMQLELEQTKRDNNRLSKLVDDLQHQMHQLNSAMMPRAPSFDVPQSGGPVNRMPLPPMPRPPIAQPVPVAMPRAPSSFDPGLDTQLAMINAHHDSNKHKLGA